MVTYLFLVCFIICFHGRCLGCTLHLFLVSRMDLGKRAMASVCPKVAPLSISYPIDFGSSSAMLHHHTQYSTIIDCYPLAILLGPQRR